MDLEQRINKVRLLMLDVDGVLTDGRIIYDSRGADLKFFDVHDGLGVYLLGTVGIKTILVTAKASRTIKHRAKDMGVVEIYENANPKSEVFNKILKRYNLNEDEVCFVGDDLVDLAVMRRVGFAVAVNNACDEIKQVSSYVTRNNGGRGAVREVAELILRAQNVWNRAIGIFET